MSLPAKPPSEQSNMSSNVRKKGTSKKLPKMYENTSDEDSNDYAYKTNTSIGVSNRDKEVAGKPFKHIAWQAPYRLDRVGSNHQNASGHMCMEKKSSWDSKASALYKKWD